jgi:hypothetical protein
MEGFIYSKKAFLGLFKTVQISRVIILERCSLREVLLYSTIQVFNYSKSVTSNHKAA